MQLMGIHKILDQAKKKYRQKLLSKTIFKNYLLSKTIVKSLKIYQKFCQKISSKQILPKKQPLTRIFRTKKLRLPHKEAASFKKSLVKDLVYVCPLFSPCCQYDMCVFSWILGRLIAFLFELNSSLFRPLPSIELGSSHTPSSGVFLGTPLSYLQFENCWFCKRLYCCVKSWRHHHVKEDS